MLCRNDPCWCHSNTCTKELSPGVGP
ncbi:SEC-C domain-containing protein [Candidatus Bipolaricaulota bacterium]|nr:SEC-C domain-containing protein [Candidatus Bipolaricaulota bacterium]